MLTVGGADIFPQITIINLAEDLYLLLSTVSAELFVLFLIS